MIGTERTLGDGRDNRHSALELVEQLPAARVVVLGEVGVRASDRIRAVRTRGRPRVVALAKLARVIREEAAAADVIEAHAAGPVAVPLLLGGLRGKTVIVHFAEDPVDQPPRSKLHQRLRDGLEGRVYRRASMVIAPTGAARRILIERHRVSPWRAKLDRRPAMPVRSADGDRAAARARLELDPDAFVVCHVSAPVPPAEAELLFEAWRELVRRQRAGGDAAPARLLLAAAGEARGALGATAVPSDCSDSIIALGALDDDQLANLFVAADVNVAISSSERREAGALAAAAYGTPSITSSAELSDLLAGLDATLGAAPRDPGALAERLASAMGGALPRRGATRDWAQQRHREQRTAAQLELYDDALAERSPHGRKMRVVYLGHVAQLSGGEIALARLIDALEGVEAHVILAEDGPLVGHLHAAGVSVEVLPLRERTRDLRKDRVRPTQLPVAAFLDTVIYVLRLARRIRAIRPDLVHTNTLKAGVYGSLAARIARVPVVWHVRDRIAADYLKRSTVMLVRTLITTLPDAVIVNSQATGRTLWRTRGRASVIPSPIPDPVGRRSIERRAHGERFVVGMIGRIAPWKGQHIFLEAFANAFASGDETAVLVGAAMFGADEADYEAELRQRAQSLGLSDRVIFRGFRSDVWRELDDMDIFVHASVTPEPFGQVVVEAMIAGTPVIATAAGGPGEIVTDGVNGLLYPPGDVVALANALTRLRHDADLRSYLSANARRRSTAFSPDAVGTTVTALYRRVQQAHGIASA